ncbi:hypothetical protein ACLOJK_014110 [Asimina triloba]
MAAACKFRKWNPWLAILLKWGLKIMMWAVFLSWVAVYFLYPSDSLEGFFFDVLITTGKTFYGNIGGVLLIFSGQILILAILAAIYVAVFPRDDPNYELVEKVGLRIGSTALTCIGLLFLPVARGSVLLRLIDVPIEQATRYHVWVGNATMCLCTLHALCFVVLWSIQGCLLEKILQWKCSNIAYLPGAFAFATGFLIWITSQYRVRRQHFELFYYTHQLYAAFIIFLLLHVGDSVFSCASGGIFIFLADRFLRFCQSRRTIEVVSAACLPCGTMELVLSKPSSTTPHNYNALSFIFLRVREISQLQWHPFSVSSSPLDGKHHLSILAKALGGWTRKLQDNIKDMRKPPKITASVEGPYGHEVANHLMYQNLVLVAGGIGISPFLAILRDIMHQVRINQPRQPKNVLVIWAVKTSKDISLLSLVDSALCPPLSDRLHLKIEIFVTQESEPVLEDGELYKSQSCCDPPMTSGSGSMSGLVGAGNRIWSGIYVVSSIIGFAIFLGLMEALYIRPSNVKCWWFKGLLFLACMIAGIFLFGGPVILLWHLWETRVSARPQDMNGDDVKEGPTKDTEQKMQTEESQSDLSSMMTLQYGCRPKFQTIFDSICDKWGKCDVGVFVCGPLSLQTSVAAECRSRIIWGRSNGPVYHFINHSFEL